MAATAATKASIMDKAKTYLNMWYIGENVNTIDDIAERVADGIVASNRCLMDKQIRHLVDHTDVLTKALEDMAKDHCIPKALGVSRPAKRDDVDLKKSRTSQAEAERIIKELMGISICETIRYTTDNDHEITSSRGYGQPVIKVDGRVVRTHEYLLRVLKRHEWMRTFGE